MQKSSFFNSVSGDRKYQASDFATYFGSLLTNGVFPNPGTNLQVISNSNMTVTVSIGKGWINGYFYLNDSVLVLTIEVADGTLKRIDRIALRMDTVNRSIVAVVKKGAFASTPVAQTLQRDADAYELALADVYVGAGVTSITGAAITDQRMNTAACGWVNSVIQADTTAIFNQYQAWFTATTAAEQADFTAWFDSVKEQLSGDVASNLANQITAINGAGGNVEKANQAAVVSHIADYVRQPAFAATTGSANTYAVSTTPAPVALVDGMSIYLDINAANTGASTLNWNGLGAIPIVDSKGVALVSGKLNLNCIVGVRYNASNANFQLLGEGGDTLTGTLTAADVLSGKTGYSTDPATKITGTMVNRGAVTITPGATDRAIAAGYHNGSGSVAGDADLVASNILNGVNIFGVVGSFVGKRSASGTTVSKATSPYDLLVTGLAFTPSTIILFGSPNIYQCCAYCPSVLGTSWFNGGNMKNSNFTLANGGIIVSSGGFDAGVGVQSTSVNWLAIE